MRQFCSLIDSLSNATGTLDKLDALTAYLQAADEKDKIWMLALFTGRRIKRSVASTKLHVWAAEMAGVPLWLFEECYQNVGDLSETIALILPEPTETENQPLHYWINYLKALNGAEEPQKRHAIEHAWSVLPQKERFVFNKLMSGAFRVGVSQALVVQAIARLQNTTTQVITHRISGNWNPDEITFSELISGALIDTDASKPYPFYLSYPLDTDVAELGSPNEWQAEWKWDGIRGQLVKRNGQLFVWSRGEELMTESFPEYALLSDFLPDGTVLDGEIICYQNNRPLPFSTLQSRINRKKVSRKTLAEAPVSFIAYDLLELDGVDLRQSALELRIQQLYHIVQTTNSAFQHTSSQSPLLTSVQLLFSSWDELKQLQAQARDYQSEGIMLKRKMSSYQAGRKRGDWWKWKVNPMSVDAVLIAAQKGHGRRAALYTDYTFAVKDVDGKLVTFAKAYSGLTDKEIVAVDAIIKKNIIEKFGPVRTVTPILVFEIGFEGIALSNRHKSGVAVRFPRILRWRNDKGVDDINSLQDLQQLLSMYQGAVNDEE